MECHAGRTFPKGVSGRPSALVGRQPRAAQSARCLLSEWGPRRDGACAGVAVTPQSERTADRRLTLCPPCPPPADDVLHTLTGAMCLLRRCRVNAALTIQLFSQLFHFINMWLFNRLVTGPESGLCSHYWGAIIRQQLGHVEAWAEKQGLELAADCHLSRIVQVGSPQPRRPLRVSVRTG